MRRGCELAFLLVLLLPRPAHAQQLSVRTLEGREWGAAIAAMQTDRSSQGRSIHVVVGGSAPSPCGSYQLALDDHGSRAFDVGACDAETGATELRLVDRLALFEPGSVVARPRRIGVAAIEIRSGSAVGGARLTAETELRCSIAARPFLVDYATGERVPATPDHFEMRLVGEGARVEAGGDGWRITSGSMRVEYELVERASGEVVLHETVALSCEAPRPSAVEGDVIELVPDRVFRGATMTRGRADDRGSCGGEEGPEQWYRMRLDAPAALGLRLVSEFDAALYVRAGSIDGPEIACRDDHALLETLEINLPAGVYYVAVDGTGTHGRYRLMQFVGAADPRALEAAPHGSIGNHERIGAELVPAPSIYQASCGGDQAPEHVYWFRVAEPTFVALRLASLFDASLYLLAADGEELGCRSAFGLGREARRSRLRAQIDPGLYYVVVDGESGRSGTGLYELDLHELPLR